MSINLDAHFAVHEQAIHLRGERTKLLATNIANVDTPNYKARDLAFSDTLDAATAGKPLRSARLGLAASDSRHFGTDSAPAGSDPDELRGARLMYRTPEAASLDGNTVDKDLEQARFAENAVRYQASLQFLQNRTATLLKSLRGD